MLVGFMTEGGAPDGAGAADRREVDARLGMVIFLASWGMVFITLFFCYAVLRLRAPVWPPLDAPPLPPSAHRAAWALTALIVASGLSLRRADRALDSRSPGKLRGGLAVALLLGIAFLGVQLYTWTELWRPGMRFADGNYQGLFYALTVFHALHVLAGIAVLLWAMPGALRVVEAPSAPEAVRARIRFRSGSLFWHFVGIAWIATFFVVYLV